jgi:type I restriction enzyme M protein
VKNKDGKLTWPEEHDFKQGKKRYKSDLLAATIIIDRFFAKERDVITELESEVADLEQQLDDKREEGSGEEGLLLEVIEGDGDKQKITAKGIKARLREIGSDSDYADEREAIEEHAALLDKHSDAKARLREAIDDLDDKIFAKYPQLKEGDIKKLVLDYKWFARLSTDVHAELERVSQTLTTRIRELAERYEVPLPKLVDHVNTLAGRVEQHLKKMGASWK